jgi:hypothetical protein
MAIEITSENFTGKFSVTLNGFATADFDIYIERYKTVYLVEMLGVELYDLFIQGLIDEDELSEKLYNSFYEQVDCNLLYSNGVIDMLVGFIYYHWLIDQKVTQSIAGGVKTKGENSTLPKNDYGYIFDRYNESIKTYKAIQQYCIDNSAVYPTFKGIGKSYKMLQW